MDNINKKEKVLAEFKKNNKIIAFSTLFLITFYFFIALSNFLEYNHYKDEINYYNLVEFQNLGFFVREDTIIQIENTIEAHTQNEKLLETAEYLKLDTSNALIDSDNIYEQNIELIKLIHTKDENYYYEPIEHNDTSYINLFILLVLLVTIFVKRKIILKFIYNRATNKYRLLLKVLYRHKKYFVIVLSLLCFIFCVHFGQNYIEYQSYQDDINKYELTSYENVGFIIKDSSLENINTEIKNQKELEELILEAEALNINVSDVLLPSITNTEEKIKILSQTIEDYIPPSDEVENDTDMNVAENNEDICNNDAENSSCKDNNQDYKSSDSSVSYDDQYIDYNNETPAEPETSAPDEACDPLIEDCNGDGTIDMPPVDEETCDTLIEDCDGDGIIDTPPISEETCDPLTEDCDGNGIIDTPPISEETCDPLTEDCDGNGIINTPIEQCDTLTEVCVS